MLESASAVSLSCFSITSLTSSFEQGSDEVRNDPCFPVERRDDGIGWQDALMHPPRRWNIHGGGVHDRQKAQEHHAEEAEAQHTCAQNQHRLGHKPRGGREDGQGDCREDECLGQAFARECVVRAAPVQLLGRGFGHCWAAMLQNGSTEDGGRGDAQTCVERSLHGEQTGNLKALRGSHVAAAVRKGRHASFDASGKGRQRSELRPGEEGQADVCGQGAIEDLLRDLAFLDQPLVRLHPCALRHRRGPGKVGGWQSALGQKGDLGRDRQVAQRHPFRQAGGLTDGLHGG
jgi:hypothetical protein